MEQSGHSLQNQGTFVDFQNRAGEAFQTFDTQARIMENVDILGDGCPVQYFYFYCFWLIFSFLVLLKLLVRSKITPRVSGNDSGIIQSLEATKTLFKW